MKLIFSLIMLLVVMGCIPRQAVSEQPLGYSFMPKYMNLDSIGPALPALPDSLASKHALSYKPKPIFGGKYIDGRDTTYLPSGILISEKDAVKSIFYEAAYKRVSTELEYSKFICKDYYDKSLAAEKLYQDAIKDLRKEVKRTWLEQNAPYIAFFGGVLTAILTEWAVFQGTK